MRWADLTPDNDCIMFADNGQVISYKEFDELTDLYAMRLKKMGIRKGDIVVTQLLAVPQFYLLVYGCLKIGAIISPLDVKEQPHEVVRDLDKIEAKAFFCLGKTPIKDFGEIAQTVKEKCSYVDHIVQLSDDGAIDGAKDFIDLFGEKALEELKSDTALAKQLLDDYEKLMPRDPALIIFTTGTTGEPKPALGMTETSGYFTCTPRGISVEELAGQVGHFYPELAKVTIRKPMNEDGTAGEEIKGDDPGEICVDGDVVFLGYYNNPEATANVISKEGILYTGDMGALKDMGTYKALVFAGRRKFVIKPKGYLVFPDEVTEFISRHPEVTQAQVVGTPHKIFVDGVFAFVQPKPGSSVTKEDILEYCKGIASYKRPIHVEFWPVDQQFPMNKTGKINVMELIDRAKEITQELRKQGSWDVL